MRTLARWLARGAMGLVAIALVALGIVYALSERTFRQVHPINARAFAAPLPADSGAIAEGERLARVRGCMGCHGDDLSGRVFMSEPGVATLIAPNLTALAQRYSIEELEHAIRHGVRSNGRALFVMPSDMYRTLTDDDMGRLLAFLRSRPRATSEVDGRSSQLGPIGRLGVVIGEFKSAREYIATETPLPAPADTALRLGHYIATTSCTECHGTALTGDGQGSPHLGGMAMGYSLEEFAAFLQTGKAKGNRELEMMSGVARGRLKYLRADEVKSLHAYLRTLVGG